MGVYIPFLSLLDGVENINFSPLIGGRGSDTPPSLVFFLRRNEERRRALVGLLVFDECVGVVGHASTRECVKHTTRKGSESKSLSSLWRGQTARRWSY